jgi:hypothetical protein
MITPEDICSDAMSTSAGPIFNLGGGGEGRLARILGNRQECRKTFLTVYSVQGFQFETYE